MPLGVGGALLTSGSIDASASRRSLSCPSFPCRDTKEKKRKEKKRKEKKRKEKKRKEKKRKYVVVVFHIQRIGCQPEKTTLHNVWVQNAPQNDVTKIESSMESHTQALSILSRVWKVILDTRLIVEYLPDTVLILE